jgi:adenosylmethionine-8-amino-7-oxononanoate aminotransferase
VPKFYPPHTSTLQPSASLVQMLLRKCYAKVPELPEHIYVVQVWNPTSLTSPDLLTHSVFAGSEAMDAAMKLGRQYFKEIGQPQRVNFIAREKSYHGNTIGALSMSGHKARRAKFVPLLTDNIARVSDCYAYRDRCGLSDDAYVAQKAMELEDKILEMGYDTVIGFVCEPISGATLGCVPYVPGYLAAMKAVCVRYGILFILDEVMCGMGRSGTIHAWQAEHSDEPGHDCRPDLQTIGKGLGGGYQAIAGLLIGQKIVDALKNGSGAFFHGHTYQAHPVACAAALAVQQVVQRENLLENVRTQGAYLSSLLHSRLDSHPYVGDIRGKGLFWGVEFVKNKVTKMSFDPENEIAKKLQMKALSRNMGIYIGVGTMDGVRGDHVILSPAYNVTKEEIETIVERMVGAINDVFGDPRLIAEANSSALQERSLDGLSIHINMSTGNELDVGGYK